MLSLENDESHLTLFEKTLAMIIAVYLAVYLIKTYEYKRAARQRDDETQRYVEAP